MKLFRGSRSPAPEQAPSSRPEGLDRRGLVVGAGVAGAAAVAAALLHRQVKGVPEIKTAAKATSEDGGYRVTPHVLRYYETTRS